MARVDSEWEKLLKISQPSVFSDETVFEILLRLPVKSIIRFKCVCKKWLELFGNSSFIAAHLKLSNCCTLVDEYFHQALYVAKVGFYLSDENCEELRKLPFEAEPSFRHRIVASVDGLVCVTRIGRSGSSLLLWNPATRELRTLSEFAGRPSLYTAIGFGFDPRNNDYKVVMMTPFEESRVVDVYSLRSDKWRSLEVESFFFFDTRATHVNGRLHWLVEKNRSVKFILSFDLTDEKFIEIGMPVNLKLVGWEGPKSLGKFLIFPCCNFENEETEIWFMKKYGDSESWSKLYSIPRPIYGYIECGQCLFLENGKVIVQCCGYEKLISYDTKNQAFKVLPIKTHAQIIKYKESLLSVEGDGSINKS